MLRSLYSGVSGLQAHQTKMDVIGNNIANVNTNGYKSSRVVFSDLFYQTLSGASAVTATTGGVNPTQIGYGALVSSIDLMNTRSGMQTTNRALDLYISGDGYFQVQDGTGNNYYTRVGNFKFDLTGNLVDSNGLYVCDDAGAHITVATIADYSNVSVSADGTITGLNTSTNTIDTLGQIALAKFTNADGLLQEGNSYYSQTTNSGPPTLNEPGTGATGSLVAGALEMSNVDLATEFTSMITTQRGYQANSRVITTSDTLLEELVNLKR